MPRYRFGTCWIVFALFFCAAIYAEENAVKRPAYRFNGGETVKIVIPIAVGESFSQQVREDCSLVLPNGQIVELKGKTVMEAQKAVSTALTVGTQLREVAVGVIISDYPPQRVYINGEVRTPQAITLVPGSPLALASALTLTGGVLPGADLSRVNVVRLHADGTRKAQVVNASKIGLPGNSDVGPTLEANDVVTIPRGDVFILAGEVSKPGALTRSELMADGEEPVRASRALYLSGGLRPSANRRAIRVIRSSGAAGPQSLPVNLDSGKAEDDPVLQNGDTLLVGVAGGVIVSGKVRAPGIYPIAGGSLKLSHLIVLAGGFQEFAKSSSVSVMRATAPRNPIRVDVNAILKQGALDKDIELQDGDVVYVGGTAL